MPGLKNDIDIKELKGKIKSRIKEKYGMSVRNFSKSPEARKIVDMKNLPVYLSPGGPVSFKVFNLLCKDLGIGTLQRKVVVKRTFKYYTINASPKKLS